MQHLKPIVLFDFDGVIADTFSIASGVARKMCVYIDEHAYRRQFEMNINKAHDEIAAADHGDPCDHDLDWFSEYAPRFHTHARPFAGMLEIVTQIGAAYRIIIVTSAHNSLIHHFLEKYDLKEQVVEVMGVDVHQLKSEKFKMIFEKYAIAPRDTVFVTDTLGDINEAAEVELASIGVEWGFQDRPTLSRGKPFRIVATSSELPDAIDDFFARA